MEQKCAACVVNVEKSRIILAGHDERRNIAK